jgi:hypothetical protein
MEVEANTLDAKQFFICTSVVDPHHVDADSDSTYHPDADPDMDPGPRFQIKAQSLEKVQMGSYFIRFGLSSAN